MDIQTFIDNVAKEIPVPTKVEDKEKQSKTLELYKKELGGYIKANPDAAKEGAFDLRAFNRLLKEKAEKETIPDKKTALQEAESYGRQLVQVASGDAELKKNLKERSWGEAIEENAGMIVGGLAALLGIFALGAGDIATLLVVAVAAVAAAMFAAPILGPMVQKWMDSGQSQEKEKSQTLGQQQSVTPSADEKKVKEGALANLISDNPGGIPYEIKDTNFSIEKDKFRKILASWDANKDGVISSIELPTISSALGGVKLNDEEKTALNIANASLHRVYNIFDRTHELKIDDLANALNTNNDKNITDAELGAFTAASTIPNGLKDPKLKQVTPKK